MLLGITIFILRLQEAYSVMQFAAQTNWVFLASSQRGTATKLRSQGHSFCHLQRSTLAHCTGCTQDHGIAEEQVTNCASAKASGQWDWLRT